ncbi:efflux RND transporter periplasmic adaptor subunit [Maricaulaceae bacterium MS644]
MRRYIFIAFVAVAFAVMALAVTFRALTSGGAESEGWGGGATPVAVYTVETQEFADVVEALGTARANESVTITAKVSDVISRLEFDSGQRVEAGAIMVELADAEEAAGLSEARATLRETTRDVDRIRDLTERGVAPRSRLDEAIGAVERARARVTAIEARVADRIIRAPFTGVVGLRNVSQGELVGPGDIIARLDDTSTIKLDFTVPERFLSVIEPGQSVRARSDAWTDQVFEGDVAMVDSRVNEATRAVTVRALIDNDEGRLRPGMLMTVELRRDERERPAIPGAAIVRLDRSSYVFLVEDGEQGSRVVRRDVELGLRTAGMVEVTGGLQPGDRIIAEGVHRLSDGAPVQVARELNSPVDGSAGDTAAVPAAAPAAG